MGRRKKFIILAVVLSVVLVGTVAGVALAQTSDTNTQTSQKTLLARVATILGIDQKKVEDAFAQARREMANEALDSRLKALVEEGKLTQQQADQYKSWWQAKPDLPLLDGKGFGRMGERGHWPRARATLP